MDKSFHLDTLTAEKAVMSHGRLKNIIDFFFVSGDWLMRLANIPLLAGDVDMADNERPL